MSIEFSERIRRIPTYPAADGYALPDDVALMASNESPDPPLPAVVDAIARTLPRLNRYPDPTSARLRRALGDRYGVPPGRISIGNGSCDILLAAGEALLEPGAELVHAWPSFSVYRTWRRRREPAPSGSRWTAMSATTWRRCWRRSPWPRAS